MTPPHPPPGIPCEIHTRNAVALVESVPLFVTRCSEAGVLIYAGKEEGEMGGRLLGGHAGWGGGRASQWGSARTCVLGGTEQEGDRRTFRGSR